jgi:hypothetical protein
MTHPRSFNHSRFVRLPEYHQLRKALSDFFNAAEHADPDHVAQLQDVVDMALTAYAGDFCACCRGHAAEMDPTCWPFIAEVEQGWLHGTYCCPRTGRTWTCGYTTNAEALLR